MTAATTYAYGDVGQVAGHGPYAWVGENLAVDDGDRRTLGEQRAHHMSSVEPPSLR